MRLPLILLLLAGLLWGSVPAMSQQDGSASTQLPDGPERILSFDSDIQILEDGQIEVSERIRVLALGQDIRRGIMREIPTVYGTRHKVVIPMELLAVQRDGASEPSSRYPVDNGVGLRIGSADVFLSQGVHEYEIRYRMDRQIGHFPAGDELYWNVNGNAWEFQIDSASCTVHPPAPVDAAGTRSKAYTGYFGSKGNDYRVELLPDGSVRFSTTRPLYSYEGLTVVYGFPSGLLSEPAQSKQIAWWLETNGSWAIAMAMTLFLLIAYFISWAKVGRDPRLGLVLREERPLTGLSAIRLRFIWTLEVDQIGMAALMLQLAEEGYLTINRKKQTQWVLTRTAKPLDDLDPEASAFINTIVKAPGGSFTLISDAAPTIRRALDRVRTSLTSQLHHVYYEMNARQRRNGIILSIACMVAYIFMYQFSLFYFNTFDFLLFLLALIILNCVFYTILPAYNELGRAVLDRIEGFRLAMRGGEDTLGEYVYADAVLTEKYLPYAVALEVERAWGWQLARIMLERKQQPRQPDWFSGRTRSYTTRDGMFDYSLFTRNMPRSLGHNFQRASVPPPPPPSSSSSSGGWGGGSTSSGSWGSSSGSGFSSSSGSSGGGGGGGGGRGW